MQANLQASVIEAYRGMKRTDASGNGKGATLQSLKELVKKDAERQAQLNAGA